MTTELDLRQLAVDRGRERSSMPPHSRRLISRFAVPVGVLSGFLALIGWAVRDRFLPSKPVTVVPVLATRAELQTAGTTLFQAAGWVEPRPTPVLVPALAEGVVAELLVVEGQEITAGQPVARLIDTDAKLALEQAKADLALRAAELEIAAAGLRAARLRLENPVHLEALLAEARSLLTKSETELAGIPFLIEAAEARWVYAQQNLSGKQAAESAIARRVLLQAQSECDGARAELRELEGRKPGLEREAEAHRQRCDALARQVELLIDETRQVAEAEAQIDVAEAREHQAQLAIQAAGLQLERTVVTAPISGRVLSLVASPGSRVTSLDRSEEQTGDAVVTLYDPRMLQVRADVRLEDVPWIQPGQPVRIETASVQVPMQGQVLHATSQANIQKNTLEVKIALTSPPPAVRPEMLVTVTFLATETARDESEGSDQQERLLVPRQLVEAVGDSQTIWLADPGGVARRRSIRLGNAGTAELVEVVEGLTPTDRLISSGRQGLNDGDRITVTGEDNRIGIAVSARRT